MLSRKCLVRHSVIDVEIRSQGLVNLPFGIDLLQSYCKLTFGRAHVMDVEVLSLCCQGIRFWYIFQWKMLKMLRNIS